MGWYLGFSGIRRISSWVTLRRFTVNSPSIKQMAILLSAGSRLRSMTNKSLFKAIKYEKITALLVGAIKEQQAIIDSIEKRINH